MSFSIRSACRADAAAVMRLRRRAILAGCKGHYAAEDLAIWTEGEPGEAFLADLERAFYLVEANGELAGSGMVDLKTGQVDAIFTDPDWTGQGVAAAMMAHLEALARQQGLAKLTLDATLNAAPFYRRCGFSGEALSHYHSPRGLTLSCVPMEKGLV
ncbi:GNAT family N-acetyltransferase [Marinobacter hydrocarbonoclasticus]|nr:GNAT family N-acetyltransferase [Marinobacter nauticus]